MLDEVAVTVLVPIWKRFGEGLPILIARELVPDFCRVNDPDQPMLIGRPGPPRVFAQTGGQIDQLFVGQAMLQSKDRPGNSVSGVHLAQSGEVIGQSLLPAV